MPSDRQRMTVVLTADETADLLRIAGQRFGGNRSAVVRAGLELVTAVYSDPATIAAADPLEALAAYVGALR